MTEPLDAEALMCMAMSIEDWLDLENCACEARCECDEGDPDVPLA